jgi:hypothetical protein
MTLSVVIPVWSTNSDLTEMALKLAKQVRPMCDELVIGEDGEYQKELAAIADTYLVHPRLGHAKNLAETIKATNSEYVAAMDSDMSIDSGDLKDLCIPGHLVSPATVQRRFNEVAGWFFVCPRQFLMEYLPYDQSSQGLPEGIDIWTQEFNRLHEHHFLSSDKISVSHGHGQSYGVFIYGVRKAYVEGMAQRKEVDPHRHKQRLTEDPEYAKMWANEEEG